MKAKLIINNQELEVEISEEEYKKLQPTKKETGYERVEDQDEFHCVNWMGEVQLGLEHYGQLDDMCYESANYYSSKTVAENNARADKLMRQLRRFAVEHRKKELDWKDMRASKHVVYFDYEINDMNVDFIWSTRYFGDITFDSEQTAQLAIDTFHDELVWYFTEYKDSL